MKLSAFLSDGMVIQQGKENCIWGSECKPGDTILVEIDQKENTTVVRENGTFSLFLPEVEAGGPYVIKICVLRNGEIAERKEIQDVLCGEVFLLCGQSNMELPVSRTLDLYEEEVKKMDHPFIRYFEVPKEHRFDRPSEDIYEGRWIPATQENLYSITALGLYFARLYERDKKVPVGLVQTAVGGAHIEAFLSEEKIHLVGALLRKKALERGEDITKCSCGKNDSCKVCYEENLNRNKDSRFVSETKQREEEETREWLEEAKQKDIGLKEEYFRKTTLYGNEEKKKQVSGLLPYDMDVMKLDVNEKKYVPVPGIFAKMPGYEELGKVRGVIWLCKTFEIPGEEWLDKEIRLYLGTLHDSDETYVNGMLIGQTEYRYPPRRYRIPEGVLREGENFIVIRMTASARSGGFVEEMPYYLSNGSDKISLEGNWEYKVTYRIEDGIGRELEDITFFNWKPTALYNQMVYPARNLRFRAILFYQGESNAKYAWEYEDLMVAMTEGFRELWKENLPFGFIQLPMFLGEAPDSDEESWQALRDAQMRAAERIENAVLVDIFDLGFKYELHPQNKMEVAKRLYEAMRELL